MRKSIEPDSTPVVYVVTDPLCSWCWGMSAAVEGAVHQLDGEVTFDLLLGGINTHATQPIGEFGQRHLLRLWREVHATTGASFGYRLPDDFVYNSTLPCIALEALRRRTGTAPFGFLHRLQQALFEEGRNTTTTEGLDWVAREFGWAPGELSAELEEEALRERVQSQFEGSRRYGTNALPSVLIGSADERRLLFGGYADSDMIVALVRQAVGIAADG